MPRLTALAALCLATCWNSVGLGQYLFMAGPAGLSESTLLQRANADGTGLMTLHDTPDAIRGITFDELNEKVYWTSSPSGAGEIRIRRANLDGSDRETIHVGAVDASDHARGIAVDPVNGFVYWAESENFRIRRARLDGSEVMDFLTGLGTGGIGPYNVDLDLAGGKLYWSEGSAPPRIQRASLDGSAIEPVGFSEGGLIRGIAFDPFTQSLFSTFGLAGDASQVVGPNTSIVSSVAINGLDLDVAGRILYWAGNDGVRRAAVGGTQGDLIIAGPGHFGPIAYTAIPEPGSASYICVALLALVGFRRRLSGIYER